MPFFLLHQTKEITKHCIEGGEWNINTLTKLRIQRKPRSELSLLTNWEVDFKI